MITFFRLYQSESSSKAPLILPALPFRLAPFFLLI